MRKAISPNKKRNKAEDPIWYVFIDESGTPFQQNTGKKGKNGKNEPFVIGAIVTDDPEMLSSIALSSRSHTADDKMDPLPPGEGEVKHSELDGEDIQLIIQKIQDSGVYLYSVTRYPQRNEPSKYLFYWSCLFKLLKGVADNGPEGEYKICIDDSIYYSTETMRRLASDAFAHHEGKRLSRDGVRSVDSVLTPATQVADIMVGEIRRTRLENDTVSIAENKRLKTLNVKTPAQRTGVHRPSAKPKAAKGSVGLSSSKTGRMDSCGRAASLGVAPLHYPRTSRSRDGLPAERYSESAGGRRHSIIKKKSRTKNRS